MKVKILSALALFALVYCCVKALCDGLSLPVVSIDINSGKCVRVQAPDAQFDCDALPDRYVTQYVDEPQPDIYRAPSPRRLAQVRQ
jgi:hypothetical protein